MVNKSQSFVQSERSKGQESTHNRRPYRRSSLWRHNMQWGILFLGGGKCKSREILHPCPPRWKLRELARPSSCQCRRLRYLRGFLGFARISHVFRDKIAPRRTRKRAGFPRSRGQVRDRLDCFTGASLSAQDWLTHRGTLAPWRPSFPSGDIGHVFAKPRPIRGILKNMHAATSCCGMQAYRALCPRHQGSNALKLPFSSGGWVCVVREESG